MMRGMALSYSNFGMLKGQESMQKRQPMHLSSRQMTGPSSVLSIALVRQAAAQAGWLQCMHCFLTKISSSSPKRFTTENWVTEGFRTSSKTAYDSAESTSGIGRPFASAQASSQPRQPMQRVVSTSTPLSSVADASPPARALAPNNAELPSVPSAPAKVFRNPRRSIWAPRRREALPRLPRSRRAAIHARPGGRTPDAPPVSAGCRAKSGKARGVRRAMSMPSADSVRGRKNAVPIGSCGDAGTLRPVAVCLPPVAPRHA